MMVVMCIARLLANSANAMVAPLAACCIMQLGLLDVDASWHHTAFIACVYWRRMVMFLSAFSLIQLFETAVNTVSLIFNNSVFTYTCTLTPARCVATTWSYVWCDCVPFDQVGMHARCCYVYAAAVLLHHGMTAVAALSSGHKKTGLGAEPALCKGY